MALIFPVATKLADVVEIPAVLADKNPNNVAVAVTVEILLIVEAMAPAP